MPSAFAQDLRYAARQLRANPGFTAVAVLSLGLGVGANSATFQLVDAVRLRTLPVANPQELVTIDFTKASSRSGNWSTRSARLTSVLWDQVHGLSRPFSETLAWSATRFNLAQGGEARYAEGQYVSGNFFRALGVQPWIGRTFTAEEDRPGCGTPGAVVSYAFWQRELGGDRAVLTRDVSLDGRRFPVIGVTPPQFFGVEVGSRYDVAVPICSDLENRAKSRTNWWLSAMGRLRPGWTEQRTVNYLKTVSPGIMEATLPPSYRPDQAKRFLENKLTAETSANRSPYWVEENLNRSDIRVDPTDGTTRPGTLLNLTINLQNLSGSACTALTGARVDVWHCDAGGIYSDEAANKSTGKKFLRGYQTTDDTGAVQFTTIYPGWYSGRTVHIHVRVRTYSGATLLGEFVDQIFFDDTLTDTVFKSAPYNTRPTRDTRNANDMVVTGTNNGAVVYAAMTQTASGYSGAATIGVNLKSAAATAPVISAAGVVNGASFAVGISAGSWVAIFGQNLAAGARSLADSDVVNNTIPTSLGGVTVTIDNKPAFIAYVSPTQLNVQAPADSATGAVSVAVTNSVGTSAAVSATLLAVAPAFFVINGAVAAVRPSDSIVISRTALAHSGDVLELFGTGFGPTLPPVAPGLVYSGSAPLANTVTVTIGGAPAPVSYAGLTAAGLYQINVAVPSLTAGSYSVLATIAGINTQAGVTLAIS